MTDKTNEVSTKIVQYDQHTPKMVGILHHRGIDGVLMQPTRAPSPPFILLSLPRILESISLSSTDKTSTHLMPPSTSKCTSRQPSTGRSWDLKPLNRATPQRNAHTILSKDCTSDICNLLNIDKATEMNGREHKDCHHIQSRDAAITSGRKPLKKREVVISTMINPSKTQRRHRIQPENMEYVDEINDKDILCGRGSRSNLHPGNKAYLKLVEIWRQRYKSTRHIKVKKAIILEIMNILQSNNVRFLELDSTNNRWYVLHERTTYKKIAQRLRDPPNNTNKKTFKGIR